MGYWFRLEALKQYRQFQEETCQKEFSEAQRLHEREARGLMALIDVRDKTEGEMSGRTHRKPSGPHMALTARYLERLGRQITAQRQVMNKAQQLCEQKRQGLITAMQKRKALEKLKEYGLNAYLQNLDHEEEKFINEMAINRHILNTK